MNFLKQITIKHKVILTIILVLIFDQTLKFWIKTNMTMHQEIHIIGNWFIIHFTENRGMAFGWEFGGNIGKMILTVFRIIAVSAICYYLVHLIRKKAPNGLIISISLILAGALGNIIDSVFYGVLFGKSTYINVAQFLPEGGGYAKLMLGQVVDMLHFPIIRTTFPSWFPFKAGEPFVFFSPVFNIADSAITVGVSILLIFQRKYFKEFK